jgi:hypothetical protein
VILPRTSAVPTGLRANEETLQRSPSRSRHEPHLAFAAHDERSKIGVGHLIFTDDRQAAVLDVLPRDARREAEEARRVEEPRHVLTQSKHDRFAASAPIRTDPLEDAGAVVKRVGQDRDHAGSLPIGNLAVLPEFFPVRRHVRFRPELVLPRAFADDYPSSRPL